MNSELIIHNLKELEGEEIVLVLTSGAKIPVLMGKVAEGYAWGVRSDLEFECIQGILLEDILHFEMYYRYGGH